MAKQAHNKPIIVESLTRDNDKQPQFNDFDFETALDSKAYNVLHEEVLRCPCKERSTKGALPNCQNCGGSGYVFINREKTLALISGLKRNPKYNNWSEVDRGTIAVSFAADRDRVAFMDKIVNLDIESIFTQQLIMYYRNGKIVGHLTYVPTGFQHMYLFDSASKPLVNIPVNSITTNEGSTLIEIDYNTYKEYLRKEEIVDTDTLKATVRFYHNPTYHIIDIIRETHRFKTTEDANLGKIDNRIDKRTPYVIHCIARKAHFLLDEPDASGESLYDNTVY